MLSPCKLQTTAPPSNPQKPYPGENGRRWVRQSKTRYMLHAVPWLIDAVQAGLRPPVLRHYNVNKKEDFKRPRTDGLKYKHENACYEQMEPRDSMRKSTQDVSYPHDVMQAEHKVFELVETEL
ncbi:uncharacterized protein LOC117162835 [Bombus vancouverensis nearcticus]|uniref:uncharacterized protein LOC117162835 n=1 Tax=Bombus vancouverensis nearcticus TaxID=2705178 RepID=UPI00402BDEEB